MKCNLFAHVTCKVREGNKISQNCTYYKRASDQHRDAEAQCNYASCSIMVREVGKISADARKYLKMAADQEYAGTRYLRSCSITVRERLADVENTIKCPQIKDMHWDNIITPPCSIMVMEVRSPRALNTVNGCKSGAIKCYHSLALARYTR